MAGWKNTFFFDTKLLGMPEVTGLVSQIEHELKQGLRGRLKEAAGLVADEMRAQTDSRRVRGAISFAVEVKSTSEYRAMIGPTAKPAFFAHFLEGGVKPHTIPNAWGRGIVVQHPGHRAHPFAAPALAATEDQVVELVGIPPSLR